MLIGYSTCAVTREAFEAAGCEAWTCDLRSSKHPRHVCGDVWELVGEAWDLGVFHPPCTYLTVAGAWLFSDGPFSRRIAPGVLTGAARREARARAVEEFARLEELPYPTAIENPARSFLGGLHRRADQVVHPWQFGDDASKLTGWWLRGVAPLERTAPGRGGRLVVRRDGRGVWRWGNQTDAGQDRTPPGPLRAELRSRTWPGMARAMGAQWGRAPRQLELLPAARREGPA